MRRVYLSFLGLGRYEETVYELNGQPSKPTRFVQVAEQMLLGWDRFDILYIVATSASKERHFDALCQELGRCRGEIQLIELDEDMSNAGQWQWFEQIFAVVRDGDELCVDLTHGYRSIPVIFSAAINFLQKTKQVRLVHLFYGAFEKDRQLAPLVDMRSFFDINIWADAVTRLTRDADARGLAEAAATTNRHQFVELSDREFTTACTQVTRRIINVDVNNVADDISRLMACIEQLDSTSSPVTSMLLEMVREKFSFLGDMDISNPDRTGYSLKYYEFQLNLAGLLLEHGLLMQAFTVMREWLSSLVMLYFEQQGSMKAKERRKRIRYGATFFNMLQYAENKWNFKGEEEEKHQRVEPFYRELKKDGILEPLVSTNPLLAKELSSYRNGFDHAWLGKAGMKDDLEQKGQYFHKTLREVLQRLERCGRYGHCNSSI
ncbi:TIGR02221 family CRISPR-associated protein [Desulfolithobacter sp.]